MKTTRTWLKLKWIVLLLPMLFSSSVMNVAHAQQSEPLKWTPLIPGAVRESILDNKALSDVEQVAALAYVLDKRITLAPLTPPEILNTTSYETRKRQPGNSYAWLINMMTSKDDGTMRPQAIATVLANFNTLSGIKNKQAVRSLLYVTLALAGGDAPESELLRLLNDPRTPQEVTYLILGAMWRPEQKDYRGAPLLPPRVDESPGKVPLNALPRLLELVDHPWNYDFASRSDPLNPRRVYPLREMALACLRELGVEAEKVLVPDNGVDEKGRRKLPITIVKVNRNSAAKALRQLQRATKP